MANWRICPTCGGEGRHSRNLGAISQEEMDHEWSDEMRETYFQGGYDCDCATCDGTGKVRVGRDADLRHARQMRFEQAEFIGIGGVYDGE